MKPPGHTSLQNVLLMTSYNANQALPTNGGPFWAIFDNKREPQGITYFYSLEVNLEALPNS